VVGGHPKTTTSALRNARGISRARLPPGGTGPAPDIRDVVLDNLVGVIALGEAADYERAVALGVEIGEQQVADLRAEVDGRLGAGPNLPFATAAIVKLSRTLGIHGLLLRSGRSSSQSERVAKACADAAFRLLMVGIDPKHPMAMPTSADGLRAIIEGTGVVAWRRLLANVAANPWGPTAAQLTMLARAADLRSVELVIDRCAKLYRSSSADSERIEVANEIRRLVAVSGCSQRQFAVLIGTSAPRLSTYVTGGVTPAATMMLRIRKQSAVMAEELRRTS
jgi:hypothetical protein